MSTKTILVLVSILMLVGISTCSFISKRDHAVTTFTTYESKVANIQNIFDKTFKTIEQSAQVKKIDRQEYESMLKAFVDRGDAYKGTMMVWVQETLAQNDKSVTLKLMSVIENARDELSIANQEANFAASEHNAYVRKTMNSLWLIGSSYGEEVQIKQITSSRAEKALETGKDDDTNLNL